LPLPSWSALHRASPSRRTDRGGLAPKGSREGSTWPQTRGAAARPPDSGTRLGGELRCQSPSSLLSVSGNSLGDATSVPRAQRCRAKRRMLSLPPYSLAHSLSSGLFHQCRYVWRARDLLAGAVNRLHRQQTSFGRKRIMRNKPIAVFAAVLIAVATIGASSCDTSTSPSSSSSGSSSGGSAPSNTVTVSLRSGGTETFTYESFSGYPTQLNQQGSCSSFTYNKSDLRSVQIGTRVRSGCGSGSVSWEITINGRFGWKSAASDDELRSVSGTSPSGERKSARWSNISSIQF